MTDAAIRGQPLTQEDAEQAWRALREMQDNPLEARRTMLVDGICTSRSPRAAGLALTVPEVRDAPHFVEQLAYVIQEAGDPWWAYRSLLYLKPFRDEEETIVKQLRAVVENSGDRRCIYFLHRYVDGLPHSKC